MTIKAMRFEINNCAAVLLGFLLLAARPMASELPGLTESVVRAEKAEIPLADKARQFLAERDGEVARVWIYLTDKGINGRSEFESVASSVTLTERALNRRRKVNRDHILFVDLPVLPSYITSLTFRGVKIRQVSRWLNAVSAEVAHDQLDQIAALPFVGKIEPIALGQGYDPELINNTRSEMGTTAALDYGMATGQLGMINVAAAHDLGFTGEGVTLTILDTGFRKNHDAFVRTLNEGRLLAEHDFIHNDGNTSNEVGESSRQWDHGTLIWSVAAGNDPGHLMGPAYKASIILGKTEVVDSETPIEEDFWVAALEWADSIGTDVVTSSLVYSDWYDSEDFDGQTAVTTIAANMADALGIVICNAIGNNGPGPTSMGAPADAENILSVGAVDAVGRLMGFSSRGPTSDGRIKPDVLAQGQLTWAASTDASSRYTTANGTSLSTPLIAGAACLMVEARPSFSPALIREALRATASYANIPSNDSGYGIIDLGKALKWPVRFDADTTSGEAPATVNFSDLSWVTPDTRIWDFGDGTTSTEPFPVHVYEDPGTYTVSLSIGTTLGQFADTVTAMISVHADTLEAPHVTIEGNVPNRIDIVARNFLPLKELVIPFNWDGPLELAFDSFSTVGLRTEQFGIQTVTGFDGGNDRASISLSASGAPPLALGFGPVLSLYFSTDQPTSNESNPIRLVGYGSHQPRFLSEAVDYEPAVVDGSILIDCCAGRVGDVNGDGVDEPTLMDIVALIDFLFISGLEPPCLREADLNQSGGQDVITEDITIGDVGVLLDYLYFTNSALLECL